MRYTRDENDLVLSVLRNFNDQHTIVFGSALSLCLFDTMSRWHKAKDAGWSSNASKWNQNDWYKSNWAKTVRNDAVDWQRSQHRRSSSESAPGPSVGDDTVPQCARPNFRSRATRSVEPVVKVSEVEPEDSDFRRRVAALSEAARDYQGRAMENAFSLVTSGQRAHDHPGPPPPPPTTEPKRAEPPKTPKPPLKRAARGHTMADEYSGEATVGLDAAGDTDLSNAVNVLPGGLSACSRAHLVRPGCI